MRKFHATGERSNEIAGKAEVTGKARWWRWWIAAAAIPLLAAAGLAAFLGLGGEGGELSDAQWTRLVRQMSGVRRTPEPAPLPTTGTTVEPSAIPAAPSNPALPNAEGGGPAGGDGRPAGGGSVTAAAPTGQRLSVEVLDDDIGARQATEYAADRAKTVVELQQFRDRSRIEISDGGQRVGTATLINLNPQINAWHLLQLEWEGEEGVQSYHLTNASPAGQSIVLQPDFSFGVTLANTRETTPCDLWSSDNPQRLDVAAARDTPYVMLCGERMTLRLPTSGRRTTKERVTDFLRDTVWGGEAITVFVRETFFQDAYLSTAELAGPAVDGQVPQGRASAPRPARLDPQGVGQVLDRSSLGLSLERDSGGQVVGEWYPLRGNSGVFASTIRPDLIAADILASHTDIVIRLDDVEAQALAYLVAFDLDEFEVAFSLGTDHPRLGWSDRVPEERRDPQLPGPDGISASNPLVLTGIIPGAQAARSVATFTGGFKRTHGGFRYGDLAMVNHGSHYGFIEDGVVFSKLQPGLSTIYVLDDGSFEMKTWAAADNALLERIRYARQNGVPIIERSGGGMPGTAGEGGSTGETGEDIGAGAGIRVGVPGAMVSRYGAGNWSGSQEGNYRTLRAGACLQETDGRRYLVYAYFSSATPSAMARVFQAYGCSYAMLLDMNALEHTYMAVYSVRGSELVVQHLVHGMEVLDKSDGDHLLPRFLGFADNRDFFYVLRRDPESRRLTEIGS